MYTELRLNLVNTVFDSWKDTGFAWEQYSPDTGKGQRTQHFTGWTSLIVRIMAMPDLRLESQPQSPGHSNQLNVAKEMTMRPVLVVMIMILLLSWWFRRRLMRVWVGMRPT